MSAQSINTKAKHVPGLNYSTKLSVEGETGYIDAKGDYHNPDFPVTRDGPLPGAAIILGSGAFSWGNKSSPRPKAFALATMRHEMMHGIQEQLAIGWLLKWRDEFTGRSFSNWLTEERKTKPNFRRRFRCRLVWYQSFRPGCHRGARLDRGLRRRAAFPAGTAPIQSNDAQGDVARSHQRASGSGRLLQ